MRALLLVLALLSFPALTSAQVPPVPTYGATDNGPSVLLSNADGSNAYTSVVRVQARATCTGVFIATTDPDDRAGDDASAWVATNGHCVAFPATNVVVREQPGQGFVVFNFFIDTTSRQVQVPIRRMAYATMKGQDIALVELSARIGELRRAGFEPWRPVLRVPEPDELVVVVGAPSQRNPQLSYLRLAACPLAGRAAFVYEFTWHWYGFARTRCLDLLPGSSGSPVISRRTGRIVALVNTTNAFAEPYSTCQPDSPCEPVGTGAVQPPGTSYATPMIRIDRCFDHIGEFDLNGSGCPLDPGTNTEHAPATLGSINPFLADVPIGPARSTWSVRITGPHAYYRYKVVRIPDDDCRDLRGYSDVMSITTTPVIADPLPSVEGHYMLCSIGGSTRRWGGDWQSVDFPTVTRVRIDMTPSTLAAPIAITETPTGYFVEFITLGIEVSTYRYKVGPAGETRCTEGSDYRLAILEFITVPKGGRPQVFCAVPYDAAGNQGVLFEKLLL
jgi:trypsin-like peptidase